MTDFGNIEKETYDSLKIWLKENVGKRFKVREDHALTFYKDVDKADRVMGPINVKDPDKFVRYLKYYITKNGTLSSKQPQVEFSNDYKSFKVYTNDANFFNF